MTEILTGCDMFQLDIRRLGGAAFTTTEYEELSDMAIQMYETEADMMNQQGDNDE